MIKEFHYNPEASEKIINELYEFDSKEANIEEIRTEIYSTNSRNFIFGTLDQNDSEIRNVGFLATYPFSGNVLIHKYLNGKVADIDIDSVKDQYLKGLDSNKNYLSLETNNVTTSIIFPIKVGSNEVLARGIRWNKNNICIVSLLDYKEFVREIGEKQQFNINHKSVSAVKGIAKLLSDYYDKYEEKYDDEFYDKLCHNPVIPTQL
ncbi:MAG: hypothetical protein KJ906_01265 [Nanoarchaeota archaeon]|nr:hypothetical protein [Nanoarchaeota archaeon]